MTKEELEILIADKPNDVKARASVLFNAVLVTMSDYNKERSAANLRNMDAAKDAFDKYAAEIGGGKSGENFLNVAAVVKYLDESGWKISDKTLYRHVNTDRKLLREPDGTFSQKNVDKYASIYLKRKSTGKREQQNTDELQRQKLEQELKNLKLKNEREKFNYEKDRGLYIPREQMEIEIAGCCSVLYAGFKHMIMTKSTGWITLVGGDTRKAGELNQKLNIDIDELMNSYASSREYEVVIKAEDHPTEEMGNE